MTLNDLGWNTFFDKAFTTCREQGWQPARLIRDNKISYGALFGDGTEREVVLGGKVYHDADTDAELPAVGDWIAVEIGDEDHDHVIRARLPRQTCLSRKSSGKSTEEQVMAANVDVVFVITDAGQDFNPRRLERYFAIIQRSGAQPVVLLNKADLSSPEEIHTAKETLHGLNSDAHIHIIGALDGSGLDTLYSYLQPGITITLVGSSGTGKSTIVNQLLGEEIQWTGEVSATTGKGMHTTTARELLLLPGGGMLIDNPGIREVQIWTDATTLRESFSDLDTLAGQCRFHDCRHGNNKGCAIRTALENGELSEARYQSYLKLDVEIAKLGKRRKKRQQTINRRNRRELKEKITTKSKVLDHGTES